MLNQYEQSAKTINFLNELSGTEIRYAFGGVQETRLHLRGNKSAAIVGLDDAVFLQAAYQLTKALNEKVGGDLTVPQFIANALEQEGLDVAAIRSCSDAVGVYDEPVVYQSREKPGISRVGEVMRGEHRVLLHPKKKMHELGEERFKDDTRQVVSGLVKIEEADFLQAIRSEYANNTDESLNSIFADAGAFKSHVVEKLLQEFCRVSDDNHLGKDLVEGFEAGQSMELEINRLQYNQDAEYYLLQR